MKRETPYSHSAKFKQQQQNHKLLIKKNKKQLARLSVTFLCKRQGQCSSIAATFVSTNNERKKKNP